MKKLNYFLFFAGTLFSSQLFSQIPPVAIGQWREHIPYNIAVGVAESNDDRIFCAGQFGLFSYSRNDGGLATYSRLNGLSDFEIKLIRHDKNTGVLLIGYLNSNIDLLFPDNTVANIPDIKTKPIIGGKGINSVLFANNLAYVACEFGIVVIDINRREIKDTYYIGTGGSVMNVNDLAFDGTNILAATDSGLYKAVYNDPNIFNFTGWHRETNVSQVIASYTSATSFQGRFYTVKTNPANDLDSLLVYDNGSWIPFISENTEGGHISSSNDVLIYRNLQKIAALDASSNELRTVHSWQSPQISGGLIDRAGNFYVSDRENGLLMVTSAGQSQLIVPNGPRSEAVWAMTSSGGRLWVASGSLHGDAPNYASKKGVYYFKDNEWKTFDCNNDPVYYQLCAAGSPALICVAVDPSDPDHAYVGSWGNGLLEYRSEGGVALYDETNSPLNSITALPGYIIVGGTTFDDEGNVWSVSGGNVAPLSRRSPDGTWQTFTIPDANIAAFGLYSLVIDDFGQKWFTARAGASHGQGICVFHENDLANPNDNSFIRLAGRTSSFNGLPDQMVRSLAKDKDGAIWIGTEKGVAVVYNPGNIFTGGNYDAQQIILEQDGHAQYLLESEVVTAIAVDGANRKWFGTSNGGVFLMSADGTEQILRFNTSNSPLPSNTITAIAIDEVSGEVFFGTDKGIFSYRGDATGGGVACESYMVFPNPVKHDYHGPIAITGLVENADVKIADIAGNIVFHTVANGGQAVWNGKNFQGKRAQTGVYVVYVTNEDGSQTCATKMLFAN